MDDCVDLALAKFSLTNVVYFNFTQMARLAGQNDITGRIRPVGRRLPDGDLHNLRMYSVLPRPFLQGATPCPFLVTPCLFKKAEMTPCLFDPKKKIIIFFFFWVKKAYNISGF